ncbi:MAG: hypothetical protein ACLQBJ_13060 [Bryobacteraceae bacterium]
MQEQSVWNSVVVKETEIRASDVTAAPITDDLQKENGLYGAHEERDAITNSNSPEDAASHTKRQAERIKYGAREPPSESPTGHQEDNARQQED